MAFPWLVFSVLFMGLALFIQAQATLSESCQKVDLLHLSLEKRLAELPSDHPRHGSIKQDLTHVNVNAVRSSSLDSPTRLHSPGPTSYASFFKPASLTGRLNPPPPFNLRFTLSLSFLTILANRYSLID